MRIIPFLVLLPLLAGCLPSAGPRTGGVVAPAQQAVPPFALIELTQQTADILASQHADSLADSFGMGGGAPTITLGVGDMVVVTVFEAASGGLFSGDSGSVGGTKNVNLPPQPVSRSGTITVPYVGQVRVLGLTPAEVQRVVETALKDKAIEPQVVVTVASSPSTSVTVAGDVRQPGRHPLNLGGDRLLDLIATAGGSTEADYNSFVRLTRGSSSATVSLARVVRDSRQNIYLRPNDLVYVYADPQVFTAFGATLKNASIPFKTDRLTLAEAVGQAGGLNDSRADPHGVFIFRYEDPETFRLVQGAQPGIVGAPSLTATGVPVVYKLDMNDPRGFFAAQRFLMRDNDVLYVSNAASVDVRKLLQVFTPTLGAASAAGRTYDRLAN